MSDMMCKRRYLLPSFPSQFLFYIKRVVHCVDPDDVPQSLPSSSSAGPSLIFTPAINLQFRTGASEASWAARHGNCFPQVLLRIQNLR